jgi:hypothetical protein
MTFSADFEQMLDEYNIDVSDRTRRLIRRNEKNEEISERTKRLIRRNNAKDAVVKEQPKENGFVNFICAFWKTIYFILSIISKITLGILTAVIWLALYFLKMAFEIYCLLIIVHVTTVAMKQYQSS